MILHFPSLDALSLALTSGIVPPAVSVAPADAAFGERGDVWVSVSVPLPRACRAELRELGVRGCKEANRTLDQAVHCWPQLLPVQPDRTPPELGEKTPVLFELKEPAQLSELVAEMLRLGNDRQSFRRFGGGADSRTLLRVVGPPYYTLLRALERDGLPGSPRAYLERKPRVWVEIGFVHPLTELLDPPPGKMLLIGPPREWTFLDEGRFRDVYEIVDFTLPELPARWQEVDLPQRLAVPLRLVHGGSADPGELWVLSEAAVAELDAFVQGADDRILARLAFAVGEREGKTVVVVRARPGKGDPPVLVLNGLTCRPWLKLPNLFVPCNTRLHPPLRRDAVKDLLAGDPDRITWLDPQPDGRFVPYSLPDTAFRPLTDWIDYILDRDHQPLEAWIEAARFEFEPFVCTDEEPPRPKPPPVHKEPLPEARPGPAVPDGDQPAPSLIRRVLKKLRPEPADATPQPKTEPPEKADSLRQRLRDLESRFLELKTPLDSNERRRMWREMARVNGALHYASDAAICWKNALWDMPAPSAAGLRAWFQSESKGQREPLTIEEVDAILTDSAPGSSQLNRLAAHLAWTADADPASDELAARLGHIQQLLEKHEEFLSVRSAWFAWVAIVKLSQGDSLALARARDRLLERLLQHGLNPDLDLPSFLRASGLRAGDRFRTVRENLVRLRDVVQLWISETRGVSSIWTRQYVDFIFAFALARLAEPARCHELLNRAQAELPEQDEVHRWLARAYAYRIGQALEGKSGVGPLPEELSTALAQKEREPRYKIDRIRQHARILEPHEKVKPYQRWQRFHDPLSQDLMGLFDLQERTRLAQKVRELLDPKQPEAAPRRARIVAVALELAPRLGEAFSLEILARVLPLLDEMADVLQQALLLERGLFLAAHYDQPLAVQAFVERFQRLLEGEHDLETLAGLEPVLSESFKGLRKLGMRDEIGWLFGKMAAGIRRVEAADKAAGKHQPQPGRPAGNRPETLKLLLQVAAGWFYFEQHDRAWPVLDEVRELLFSAVLPPFQQTPLACAYAAAVGHAPAEMAFNRLEELFKRLKGITDTFTTNSHYSLSQMDVVEAAVLALVSDDFAMDQAGRRWLEDDEFLVRRRIHRDVRAMIESQLPALKMAKALK